MLAILAFFLVVLAAGLGFAWLADHPGTVSLIWQGQEVGTSFTVFVVLQIALVVAAVLLFLDEPTSGLDSQTSWNICNLMEKLTKNGQAILCTIHQPSAMLFQRFDRLLLLAKGGRTVYFGEIGKNSQVLLDYFRRNGGQELPAGANPAEHMLEVIGAAPGAHSDIDWPAIWRDSKEYSRVKSELGNLRQLEHVPSAVADSEASSYKEFAVPFATQLFQVCKRVFQQYWRTPSYIYSKSILCIFNVSAAKRNETVDLELTCRTGLVYRILVLQRREHYTRPPEPDVWCFHLSVHHRHSHQPDSPGVCHSEDYV